jgi:hypothetical protein
MKKPQYKNFNDQIKINQNFTFKNEAIKTTNINILLNRVRKKKSDSKKKLILLIFLIGILPLISIMVFVN